jgi:hypothetical protein
MPTTSTLDTPITNTLQTSADQHMAEPAPLPGVRMVPLYGAHGWRVKNAHRFPFASDGGLRWFVDENRAELIHRRALAMVTGRICAVLPAFEIAVVDIGAARMEIKYENAERDFESLRPPAEFHSEAV